MDNPMPVLALFLAALAATACFLGCTVEYAVRLDTVLGTTRLVVRRKTRWYRFGLWLLGFALIYLAGFVGGYWA